MTSIDVLGVIQARVGSTRFPSKMTARLGDRRLIDWILDRVTRATRVDTWTLATSIDPGNEVLAEAATDRGCGVLRGDEADVLSRFVAAAQEMHPTWVVRVCADNPFTDPAEIDRLVTFALVEQPDYAFNHLCRLENRYADGFGAEIVQAGVLLDVAVRATLARHREHVTQYLWDHADAYRLRTFPAPAGLAYPELKFDVDTPGDLDRLQPLAGLGASAPAEAFVTAELARRA